MKRISFSLGLIAGAALLLFLTVAPPLRAQFYRPFSVWANTPLTDYHDVVLDGSNPADPDWSGQTGALVQILHVGANGSIDPPDSSDRKSVV